MRTLLIIAAIFFGVRLIMRYLIPFLLSRFIKKQQEKFNRQFGGGAYRESRDEEGEVKVKDRKKSTSSSGEIGEYVDYEEIDESK